MLRSYTLLQVCSFKTRHVWQTVNSELQTTATLTICTALKVSARFYSSKSIHAAKWWGKENFTATKLTASNGTVTCWFGIILLFHQILRSCTVAKYWADESPLFLVKNSAVVRVLASQCSLPGPVRHPPNATCGLELTGEHFPCFCVWLSLYYAAS